MAKRTANLHKKSAEVKVCSFFYIFVHRLKGGEFGPVDKSKSIIEKINQAIKNRVTGRIYATSNRAVSIVFGGNREQMRNLAFGDQTISENGNN